MDKTTLQMFSCHQLSLFCQWCQCQRWLITETSNKLSPAHHTLIQFISCISLCMFSLFIAIWRSPCWRISSELGGQPDTRELNKQQSKFPQQQLKETIDSNGLLFLTHECLTIMSDNVWWCPLCWQEIGHICTVVCFCTLQYCCTVNKQYCT